MRDLFIKSAMAIVFGIMVIAALFVVNSCTVPKATPNPIASEMTARDKPWVDGENVSIFYVSHPDSYYFYEGPISPGSMMASCTIAKEQPFWKPNFANEIVLLDCPGQMKIKTWNVTYANRAVKMVAYEYSLDGFRCKYEATQDIDSTGKRVYVYRLIEREPDREV